MSLFVAAVGVIAALAACQPPPLVPGNGSVLVPCSSTNQRIAISQSSHLDPTCTYRGIDITGSNVTLDCLKATISGPQGYNGAGILIHTPVDVAMSGVTVKNCKVEGFVNSLKVTRDGFRTLPDDQEFEHPISDVLLTKNVFQASRGVGIFVDGYVSGVTILDNQIVGTGSSGIYLETGSKGTHVEGNHLKGNGFSENGANGTAFDIGGSKVWFWGPGREGLSIDGSYENTIKGNVFEGNSAGGVFLYKNCGEYPDRRPERWFERRDHSDDNLIEGNVFVDGRNGVWVGSRMGENMYPMECSDPKYVSSGLTHYVLDHADDNIIRGNYFGNVTYGIRVEDDGTVVEGNEFLSTRPADHAVIVGTPHRTQYLGQPVKGTVLRDNVSTIPGNVDPYRWVHGHVDTVEEGNSALGAPTSLCEGQATPRQVMVMVIAVAAANPDGSKPPTPNLTVPVVPALPACEGTDAATSSPAGNGTAAERGTTSTTAPTTTAPGSTTTTTAPTATAGPTTTAVPASTLDELLAG